MRNRPKIVSIDTVKETIKDPKAADKVVSVCLEYLSGDLGITVCDNRTGDAWVEHFETIASAMAYALEEV